MFTYIFRNAVEFAHKQSRVTIYRKEYKINTYICPIKCTVVGGDHLRNSTTIKHVLSGHSKIDKTNVVRTNGSLMKVKSIA